MKTGSKKTSGNVTIMLTKIEKVKKSREHRPAESKRSKMEQKKTSVFGIFMGLTAHAHSFQKMRKKVLMLVFFGPFTRFFHFFEMVKNPKKMEKCPKNRDFSSFSLCSAALFVTFMLYAKCSLHVHFRPQNKNTKNLK
jgi:hypothetical protein